MQIDMFTVFVYSEGKFDYTIREKIWIHLSFGLYFAPCILKIKIKIDTKKTRETFKTKKCLLLDD
jgi:hypothetical protein